jgi:hypothetical protein
MKNWKLPPIGVFQEAGERRAAEITGEPPGHVNGRSMEYRLETLMRISGVCVSYYMRRGTAYFVFGPKARAWKTVCTYRKARVFAEGVALGRRLTEARYQ